MAVLTKSFRAPQARQHRTQIRYTHGSRHCTAHQFRRHPGHHICPSWSSRPHSGSRRTRCLQWKQRLNGGRSIQQLAAVTEEAVQAQELADWLPEQAARQLTDPLVLRALRALQRRPTHVPRLQRTVQTAFLSTEAQAGTARFLLLPGFDGSCLEFRRLLPLLDKAGAAAWAVDVVGWGFSGAGSPDQPWTSLGPKEKRDHLLAFWQDQIKQPVVLVGTSLGAATAIDFALTHPEAVQKLVLIDGQAWVEGIGPMSSMPRWLAVLGVQVLRSKMLRRSAGRQAYHDKSLATEEAMLTGRLHTWMPGWSDAIVAFMQSGGYRIASQITDIAVQTLIIWGRNDEILDPKLAEQFREAIPDCQVTYVEDCGHCAHIEQAEETARLLLEFAGASKASQQLAN